MPLKSVMCYRSPSYERQNIFISISFSNFSSRDFVYNAGQPDKKPTQNPSSRQPDAKSGVPVKTR